MSWFSCFSSSIFSLGFYFKGLLLEHVAAEYLSSAALHSSEPQLGDIPFYLLSLRKHVFLGVCGGGGHKGS